MLAMWTRKIERLEKRKRLPQCLSLHPPPTSSCSFRVFVLVPSPPALLDVRPRAGSVSRKSGRGTRIKLKEEEKETNTWFVAYRCWPSFMFARKFGKKDLPNGERQRRKLRIERKATKEVSRHLYPLRFNSTARRRPPDSTFAHGDL